MIPTDRWDEQAARVYRFLGRAFLQPPDRPFLEEVAAWCERLLAQGEKLPTKLREALRTMRAALGDLTEERVQMLQEEFVRLLRGISPRHSPPPPYESVYREGKLWGEATAAVCRIYAEWGLAPDKGRLGHEPPDHLGLELQFMGFLCARERRNGRTAPNRETQRAFLEKHLDWIDMLREHVQAFDPDPFYEGLLALTQAWLRLHREYLSASSSTDRDSAHGCSL